ncbi:hypothetical protein ACFPLB_10245 [Aquamicrobium segne]|uniref:Uncharacterized protein n=1 Tax=Aquamicrobium segne TaxID=469547 RepID=A0ABW0GXF4_9HYPH
MSQNDKKPDARPDRRGWETLTCLARIGVLFAPAFVGLLALAILSGRQPQTISPQGIDLFMTGSIHR